MNEDFEYILNCISGVLSSRETADEKMLYGNGLENFLMWEGFRAKVDKTAYKTLIESGYEPGAILPERKLLIKYRDGAHRRERVLQEGESIVFEDGFLCIVMEDIQRSYARALVKAIPAGNIVSVETLETEKTTS